MVYIILLTYMCVMLHKLYAKKYWNHLMGELYFGITMIDNLEAVTLRDLFLLFR